ncbi:MAG: hypothetical protein IPL39_23945 [Opitutaceae bacterium]|nr:hypothetical protein [Opitutaceae bacterium]
MALIGEYCQGGFDGWYEVRKGPFGSMVWNHLLLMKLPDSVDEEKEDAPYMRGKTFIATRLLERKKGLFYSDAGALRYFPFGTAICFQSRDSATEGYLAFDFENRGQVVFICEDRSEAIDVAPSFSEMMRNSVFQFYG